MSTDDSRRHLDRAEPRSGLRVFHVVFPSTSGNIEARVLDFHFKGASLTFERAAFERFCELPETGELHFYLGQKCLKFGATYRVAWRDQISCHIGIEFRDEIRDWIQRDLRIPTHPKIRPTLSSMDPTDPNRRMFYSVGNVSSMGMMLSTSLTNKHLFPGMELRGAQLVVPGKDPVELDLSIQNVHLASDGDQLLVGTAIRSRTKKEYAQAFQDYLSALGDLGGIDQSEFKASVFFSKKLKSSLTFRPVTTEAEYKKVLELRFLGYGHKGKVRQGQTLEDMGEGLIREGLILGAYLGRLLVASVEIRFGSDVEKGFRFVDPVQLSKAGIGESKKYAEINKLVVHPSYQGSDVLLGVFHRMHAIGVSEGGLGAIIAATDQLKNLYVRVGASDTGLRVPHPHLQGVSLNVLVIESSVYMGQTEFNPFLWKTVYGVLGEYLAAYKIVVRPRHSRIKYYFGTIKFLFELWRKKRSRLVTTKLSVQTSKVGALPADISKSPLESSSHFTQQQIHASRIKPYLIVADQKIGVDRVDEILTQIGLGRDYFEFKSNWVSVDFLDKFLDAYAKLGDLGEISIEAGRISMSREILGINYHLLKSFGDHRTMVKVMTEYSPRFNKTRTIKVIDITKSRALVELGVVKGFSLPKHKESCLNWQSSLKHAGLIAGGEVDVKKLSCAYDGDPTTIYEITWTAGTHRIIAWMGRTLMVLSVASIFHLSLNFWRQPKLESGLGLFLVLVVSCLFCERLIRKKEEGERDDQAQRLSEESEIKYADLQEAKSLIEHRYQEALLLDKISMMIQVSSDLSGILHTGLKQACELLEYSRAFVMILNTETMKLETAAVNGTSDAHGALSKFSVDVSVKRENPVLLSSVYHSGQSVMINNVKEHIFQLNKASQALVTALNVERFVMVAVPSEKRNWGVIVAEKSSTKSELSKKDLVLLERVGQMMGVALDKHAALESETRLRKSFQRYVPASAIEQLMNSNSTHLGGIEKKICALFLDIRAFTHIASTFGPQMSVDLLNRFFSFVQPIFTQYGGTIDKYLGDGVLVTWGAFDSSPDIESRAVEASLEVLARLSEFNQLSVGMGMPNIQIGIGVHAGPAIVGNVGSAARMEYTAIGHTVNYASRLETLNKVYQTNLCLSEQVVHALSSTLQSRFSRISGVAVRGVQGEANIAVLDFEGEKKDRGAA